MPSNLHTTHAPDVCNWVWDAASGEWLKMTQPGGSSSGLTDTELRATPVPVTGVFYPTTQPVSGLVTTDPPANATTNITQIGGLPPVQGTGVRTGGTLRVTVATDDVVPVIGTFWQLTQPVSLTGVNLVTQAALTKGTQSANGVSTQDLKDAGRNMVNYFMAAAVAATSAEVMQSLTGYKSGAAVGATATPAQVTSGKTFRVTSITLAYQSIASAGGALIRLRANLIGTAGSSSPLVAVWAIGSASTTAGVTTTQSVPFPEGLEFAAPTGIAIGVIGLSAANTAAAAGFVTVTITGFEY